MGVARWESRIKRKKQRNLQVIERLINIFRIIFDVVCGHKQLCELTLFPKDVIEKILTELDYLQLFGTSHAP